MERADIPSPELSRFLYTAVGGPWYWTGRLGWDYARWLAYLDRPVVETLVIHTSGTPAGYMETEVQADDNVEVVQFGLLPRFLGQGLGGHLLSTGLQRAWDQGTALRDLLAADQRVRPLGLDLAAIFDYERYVRYADEIVGRLDAALGRGDEIA